ncbi:MAG TPA: RnfH family protein [Lysobacter sp.]|nr:RnfH family protein [Lysobacter sp.]
MKVGVICAWPGRHEWIELELPSGACLCDALKASGMDRIHGITGYAVFGINATLETSLHDGDRVELLRPLTIDPKEARRRRAKNSGT